MKYITLIIAICFLTSCVSPPSVKTGLEGKPMPSFNVQLTDSTTQINTNSIHKGSPTVFVLFTPSCVYCRAQTQDIVNNIQSLSEINFYILSNHPINEIKKYIAHYKLNKYSNIIVGRDSTSYLLNYFSASNVPLVAVYNKEKKLKQVFPGRVESTEIKTIAFE